MPNKWVVDFWNALQKWPIIEFVSSSFTALTITYYVGASIYALIKRKNKSNSPKAKASISQLRLTSNANV